MNVTLKLALISSGIPAYRVAASAGLSESALSRIVRGRRLATDEELRLIARVLRVPVAALAPAQAPAHSTP